MDDQICDHEVLMAQEVAYYEAQYEEEMGRQADYVERLSNNQPRRDHTASVLVVLCTAAALVMNAGTLPTSVQQFLAPPASHVAVVATVAPKPRVKPTAKPTILVAPTNQYDYRALARYDAQLFGINPTWFERQINQESGFSPNALSPAGAIGIAQIMPQTALGWNVDPTDPRAALYAAAKAMASYYHDYGNNYAKALAAYNAGTGAVNYAQQQSAHTGNDWTEYLPLETRNYIAIILG